MLNEDQQKIVQAPLNTNILIIACAGAGKTTTLLKRIEHMISNLGVHPRDIILSTFTVEATNNMKSKLRKLIGTKANELMIGTLDSISLKVLLKHAPNIIGNGFNKTFNVSEYSPMFLDFLLHHENRHVVLNQCKFLIIDEYQDINDIQFKIFDEFFKAGTFITAVGDDSQNIYSFRGSDVSYIINFNKQFIPCETFQLLMNYRSADTIVRFANHSIKKNLKQIEKSMIAHHKGGTLPSVLFCHDFHETKKNVEKIIGYSSNVAILSRYRKTLYDMEDYFEEKNISYVFLDGHGSDVIDPKVVTLCTIHKSKGLEWDTCIIIGVHDDLFPKNKNQTDLEEERRLFYVAATRAKKRLYFLYNKVGGSNAVSRFIYEIPSSYYSHNLSKYNYPNLSVVVPDEPFKVSLSITNLIPLLKGEDYIELRKNKILPQLFFTKTILHSGTKHPEYIVEQKLELNIGLMTDLLMCRMVSEDSYFAKKPRMLLSSVELNSKEMDVYNYTIRPVRFNSIEFYELYRTTTSDIVREIVDRIIQSSKDFGIEVMNVPVHPIGYIPTEFKVMIWKYIEMYEDITNKWDDLLLCCFWLANCSEILGGRKLILYKKIHEDVLNEYLPMFRNIQDSYWSLWKSSSIHTLFRISNGIHGEIDALHDHNDGLGKRTLIDWKLSYKLNVDMVWIMQLLCYTHLGRMNKHRIDDIGIYNPLKGILLVCSIGWWNGGEKLFEKIQEKL
jgi:hypothetical protein